VEPNGPKLLLDLLLYFYFFFLLFLFFIPIITILFCIVDCTIYKVKFKIFKIGDDIEDGMDKLL
jgi:hypothetical protein